MRVFINELSEKNLNKVSKDEITWNEAIILTNENLDRSLIKSMRSEVFVMKYNQLLVKFQTKIVTENLSKSFKQALLKKCIILAGSFACSFITMLLSNKNVNAKENLLMTPNMMVCCRKCN